MVSSVRFCVPCEASGTPLAPEPLREVELWCDLVGWGRVHVGNIPVPYDADFKCAFPRILEAVLHRVPPGAAPPATAHASGRAALPITSEAAGVRHVVSLQLADEPLIIAAAEAQLFGSVGRVGGASHFPR